MLALLACSSAPVPVHLGPSPASARVSVSGVGLARAFDVRLSAALRAELRCTSPVDGGEDHHLPLVGSAGRIDLVGLLADTPYDCVLADLTHGGELWSGSFTTEPLPDGLPSLRPSGDRARASVPGGYVLFTHFPIQDDTAEQRLIIVDGDGRIRWWMELPDAHTGGLAGSLTPDGLVLVGGGQSQAPSLWTLGQDLVFAVPPAQQADPGYHHEAVLSPEGWVTSLQGITDPTHGFMGFRVEAVDVATGELRWAFDSAPWVANGGLPLPADPSDDPYHANAVAWVDDDPEGPSVWVSLRGAGELIRLDRDTADLVGYFGPGVGVDLVGPDGAPLPDEDWFWGQHAPEFRGDEVLVYDNGGRRPGDRQYSRVARYRRLDPHTAELVWDWTEPGWYEPNFGSAVTLPDGHVLVATGHCYDCGLTGDRSWIAEVDPVTDAVVWRLDFGSEEDGIYRAQLVDGCALFANARYCPR